MRLIVGLGNPGRQYLATRHNVGFAALEVLARLHGVSLGLMRFDSLIGRGRLHGTDVLLALPQTYMNLSGGAVKKIVAYFRVGLADLLVLHDDLDIESGRIKVAAGGGAGGHKGVASIIAALGSEEFARIRIGIGRPPAGWETESYVLGRFSPEEAELMDKVLASAARAAEVFVTEGVAAAQAQYNRKALNVNE
ncbi:MAG: aminoacyl-tRNA hydrolase [Thermodesulfobacteriota bacterium]